VVGRERLPPEVSGLSSTRNGRISAVFQSILLHIVLTGLSLSAACRLGSEKGKEKKEGEARGELSCNAMEMEQATRYGTACEGLQDNKREEWGDKQSRREKD
jgi:hypothetical protein